MSAFVRQAEDILEIAARSSAPRDTAIVVSRRGALQMLDATGWSLPGLSAEFGAAAVFRVEHRGRMLRVEGFNGTDRCLLQRELAPAYGASVHYSEGSRPAGSTSLISWR